MLDVAIIGGGLCGLALAHSLQARGSDWRLYEARERLGGRVLTAKAGDGTPVDLGPTWFWPDSQPAITRLVADLGLTSFDQLDDGRVLHLADPNRVPQTVALTERLLPADDPAVPARAGAVHCGARRVAGGVGAVIDALAAPLPNARLRTGHRLDALVDHGDFVELRLRFGEAAYSVNARRVVLALPPRVAEASVQFVPDLAPDLRDALQATPTWMATAAKAGFTYPRAFWRDSGHTGNAWVSHAQAMLAEVFDACGPDADAAVGMPGSTGAALAGFAALGAAQRESFTRGRALLLESQLVQLFGPEAAEPAESFWQDWALEAETCSPIDLASDVAQGGGHPNHADPILADAHWNGRLYFGGSETARQGGGYLEGALGAAGRLRRQLLAANPGALHPREAANEAFDTGARDAGNERQLERFAAWVSAEHGHALERYRERVHRALSQQDDDRLTQRAVLASMASIYDAALQQLEHLPLATSHLAVEQGRCALTPRVLEPFTGLADQLLADAMIFNKTSCALSNFPGEHRPNGDYVRTIRRDLASAWQSFSVAANERLLAKARRVASA